MFRRTCACGESKSRQRIWGAECRERLRLGYDPRPPGFWAERRHEPTEACHDQHCHSCGVDEPIPAGAAPYLVCFECGHVYWTRRALRRAYRIAHWKMIRGAFRARREPPPSWWAGDPAAFASTCWGNPWPELASWLHRWPFLRADRITFCQECSHDF